MKFSDLLRMSGSNLLRRKLRTALTVLGVVIGTASIVVMNFPRSGTSEKLPGADRAVWRFDDHQCKYLGKL